jgi:hypothetical protein
VAGVAVFGFLLATCETTDQTLACQLPIEGTKEAQVLNDVRSRAALPVLYPCQLPAGSSLLSGTVTGPAGRQQVEMISGGAFDLTLRQSQYPPAPSNDPVGASRTLVQLFPNVQATLVETVDGSNKAQYHLMWTQGGIYYEIQALGPPLRRDYILAAGRSLSTEGLTPEQMTPQVGTATVTPALPTPTTTRAP